MINYSAPHDIDDIQSYCMGVQILGFNVNSKITYFFHLFSSSYFTFIFCVR